MSITSALMRQLSIRRLGVLAISLALFANACGSSDSSDNKNTIAKGGAVSKGGASSKGGSSTATGGLVGDPWVPPEAKDEACSIGAAELPLGIGGAANVGAAGAASANTAGVAGIAANNSAGSPSRNVNAAGSAGTAAATAAPEFLNRIGCRSDFDALSSTPLSASIPGAVSVKVVFDIRNVEKLYFQNSKLYQIHYEFASTHLSVAQGMPDVGALPAFNQTEYSSPNRHFILGAVTYYEGPKYWALELAPYDTADTAMVERLYRAVKANAYFGDSLVVHPTSNLGETAAADLPADVHVKTTAQIFAGIDYQPLNVSQSVGTLRFVAADELENAYFSFRDIVVLEAIPGDISVTAGIITAEFQTPLSHINVLSMNRGTPNMGLRGAMTNEKLRALSGKPVKLVVAAEYWSITEVTEAESTAWWEAHRPKPIDLPSADLSVTDLRNIESVVDEKSAPSMFQAITNATYAFGAKAANYSILANTPNVPVRKAFGIPIYYYMQFMQENGFDQQVKAMLADPEFQNSLPVQELRLTQLRTAMLSGKINKAFETLLKNKIKADYANEKMRFRTSTNAEDLNGFPCAGCYDSHSGDPGKWDSVLLAIKETWSGVWFYRTFREREYNGIDHLKVGMGLLVHHNFDEEEANGVAVTQNIFVPSGLDPAYYINVQWGGDSEVVNPKPGTTSDEFLFYLRAEGDTIVSISHSNLIPTSAGRDSVLTARQVHNLGLALNEIHKRFDPAYGFLSGNTHWYAMDVEFKFDNELAPDKDAQLYIKQARPYPDPSK